MTDLLRRSRERRAAPNLAKRLDALQLAVDLGAGRLPAELTRSAERVVERSGRRLALSPDHTVVALAGSTGSGKSSLFNALVQLDLAAVGARRPTTATAMACVWSGEGSAPLLDWLGLERRHQVMRSSVLEDSDPTDLEGLILLDLPDHDSTEEAHRTEVLRLADLVDMLVWVVDPEKYADAALHHDVLRPLGNHANVMAFVLNQADRLSRTAVDACRNDLRRLLDEDGFAASPLLVTSARTGLGVPGLRSLLAERVLARRTYLDRVAADLATVAARLTEECGTGPVPLPDRADISRVRTGLAHAAGVDGLAAAAGRSYRQRAAASTGWPPVRWISRLRPDPMRRLGLARAGSARRPELIRTSRPPATPVQRAQVDTAVRRYADIASTGLPEVWATATRRAAWSRIDDVPDAIDNAIARTDLKLDVTPLWWRAFSVVHWVLLLMLVVGLGWLGLLAIGTYVGLPDVPTPALWGVPLPTALVAVGGLGGLLLALVARLMRASGGRRVEASTARLLRSAVGRVSDDLVAAPVQSELSRLNDARAALVELGGPS